MDEIRKNNVKSIVAQRLVLFNALEKGRARTDDGSPIPILYENYPFIYNSGLSSSIISDIKKGKGKKKLKLTKKSEVGERSLSETEDYISNDNMAKWQRESELHAIRQSEGGVPVTNSIKHLISLFENSSMQLTARNSLEEDTIHGSSASSSVPKLVEQKAENSNVVKDPVLPLSSENDICVQEKASLGASPSNPLPSSNTEIGSPAKSEDILEDSQVTSQMSQEDLQAGNAVQNEMEINNIEKQDSLPRGAPAENPKPKLPESINSEVEIDKGTSQLENAYENCPMTSERKLDSVKSMYIDPSFNLSRTEQQSPEKPPIKKRTLGRGEIKPYEIVDLVIKEDKKEVDKPSRMESMYVETFGGKSSSFDADGYQTIPEYSEPTIVIENEDSSLDQNEFDLSNLGNEVHLRNNEHQHCRKPDMKSHSLDSSLNSNYLSISSHSDFNEGWDSDEFDYYTDDDALEDKRKSQTCDVDVAKKKILNIVNEILTTEKAYEKRLHLLDKVFQARLMKEAKENSVIPEKVVQEIFSNLSSIYVFHSTMLRPDLEKRISNWSSNEKIGDIFKTLGHCLKLYTDYVKNFDHATTTLNQWTKKSPKFASIIEEIQKLPECEHLSLQHHMLGPIQRIPRYKLLLTDYLKKLPEDSPDRAEAEESLVVISTAADHANNSMKGMDEFKKLVEIEERISEGLHGESLATASRLFIKEGELVKIAARSDQKNLRILLLFNDLLLCCNKIPATGKLKVKQMMDIPGMTLQDNEDIDLGEPYAFRVKSRQRVLDLAASNEEEKNEWMTAISGVIQDYEAKRGSLLKQYMEEDARKEAEKSNSMKIGESAPVWVKDEDVTMCMLCAVRFSFLSRRHHCRSCGRIVCDNCSKYKAQLAYTNNSVKRVCYVCHRKLNVDKIQQTDSYILKKTTIDRVARDPKRRRSTIVSEIKGDLLWKAPGRKWDKGWFAISDMVLYAHKGRKDPKAQVTIALPGYSVCRPQPSDDIDEGKHPFAFKVHFGNKKDMTYFFQAEDETKMERWMDVITYSIKAEKPPSWSKTL